MEDHGEEQGLIILADGVVVRHQGEADKPLADKTTFWTRVGEDDCYTHMEGRFAPMLRGYPMCPQMMTENNKVENGEANGTQGDCVGVRLKHGESVHYRKVNGFNVKCVYASQVDHVKWRVGKRIIKVKPKQYNSLRAKFPLPPGLCAKKNDKATVHLRATQIPLISNDATTGHKLQGSSVDAIYIPSWSYNTNWPYVMLSRVRTLKGLFLGRPLDPNADYSVPQDLTRMIRQLKKSLPEPFDYSDLEL